MIAEVQAAKQKTLELEKLNAERAATEQALQEAQIKLLQQRESLTREFRSKLTIGSETFCGPVIAIRPPMVQIAINAPLPGYSAEPWLRLDEIYPAAVAVCKNTNGRLTPFFF